MNQPIEWKAELKESQRQEFSIQKMCVKLKTTIEKALFIKLNKVFSSYMENLVQEQLNFNMHQTAKFDQSVKKQNCRDLLKVLNDVKKQNPPLEINFTRKEIVTLILMMYLDLIQFDEEKNFIHFQKFHYKGLSEKNEFKHLSIQYYLVQSFSELQDDCGLVNFKVQSVPLPENYKSMEIEVSEYQTQLDEKWSSNNNDTLVNFIQIEQFFSFDPFFKQQERTQYQYPEQLIRLLFIKQLQKDEAILVSNLMKFNDYKAGIYFSKHTQGQIGQTNSMLIIDAFPDQMPMDTKIDENYIAHSLFKCYIGYKLTAHQNNIPLLIQSPHYQSNQQVAIIRFLIQIWGFSMASAEVEQKKQLIFSSDVDDYASQLGIRKQAKLQYEDIQRCLQKILQRNIQ